MFLKVLAAQNRSGVEVSRNSYGADVNEVTDSVHHIDWNAVDDGADHGCKMFASVTRNTVVVSAYGAELTGFGRKVRCIDPVAHTDQKAFVSCDAQTFSGSKTPVVSDKGTGAAGALGTVSAGITGTVPGRVYSPEKSKPCGTVVLMNSSGLISCGVRSA